MTLRRKTLIVIGLTVVGLIAVLYVVSQSIVSNSHLELETRFAGENVERAVMALEGGIAGLELTAGDWAPWNETAAFIEGRNEDYVENNLVDDTFVNLRLNLMAFTDTTGQIVYGRAFDLLNEEVVPVPRSLGEHIHDDSPLVSHSDAESTTSGIILLPEGPMLVASHPILNNEHEGPVRGALILGRFLDSSEIATLASITLLSLEVHRLDEPREPAASEAARSLLSGETTVSIRTMGSESIVAYALLEDVYEDPVILMRAEMPREIMQHGEQSLLTLAGSLAVFGLILGALMVFLLERLVLARVIHLSRSVAEIGRAGDISKRVSVSGRDELSELADNFNSTLAGLEAAQAESLDHARRVEAIFEIGATVGQTLNLTELIDNVLVKVLDLLHLEAGGVFLLDKQSDELVLRAHRGLPAGFIRSFSRVKVGEGRVGRAALTGKPILQGSTLLDSGSIRTDPTGQSTPILGAMPIIAKDQVLGVMCIDSYPYRPLFEQDIRLLAAVSGQIGMAIANAQLYEQTAETAVTDGLTGLFDRRYLVAQMEPELARTRRNGRSLSLIMVDLDGLKGINDHLGHQAGDVCLKELADIIRANTRATDVAARWGGDEFLLLATETDSTEALIIGERIRSTVAHRRPELNGVKIEMSVSVGVASYPAHGSDIERLVQRADEAMYAAKREGKNRTRVAPYS